MTCPVCKTDNGITDSVSSGGLVTRAVCPDVFHVNPAERLPPTATPASEAPRGLPDTSKDSRLEHPYTTPVPAPTQNGASGFVYCNVCEKPQPTSGHECFSEGPSIDTLRAALSKMHARACGDESKVYMSIPAEPARDADLLLSAALDELERLRAARKP